MTTEVEAVDAKTTEPRIVLVVDKIGVMLIMQHTEAIKVPNPKKPSETVEAYEVTLKGVLSVDDFQTVVQLLDGHKLHARIISKREADTEDGTDD